jgi:hypothetical protein
MKYSFGDAALSLVATAVLAACAIAPTPSPTAVPESNQLVAIKVGEIALDEAASFWADAPRLELPTRGVGVREEDRVPGPTITLQAAYDASSLVLRAEWADPTESIWKNAWTWDGSTFTKSGDEDRLMFHWPMGNYAEFATKGCGAICHADTEKIEEWWMGSTNPDERYDQWHWKSTLTNPVGQADDRWLGIQADPTDMASAHYGDAKEGGGEKANVNEEKTGPAFMNGRDPTSPFIFAGEEIPIDISALSPGTIVPGYILSPFVGSRGDVAAKGTWSDGKWTVLIRRALNTGHDDDVVFTPPKPVPFGVAVMDNNSYKHMVVPKVVTLRWR